MLTSWWANWMWFHESDMCVISCVRNYVCVRSRALRRTLHKSGSSLLELCARKKHKKYSESTVLSHFSWESRKVGTLNFRFQWFSCEIGKNRSNPTLSAARTIYFACAYFTHSTQHWKFCALYINRQFTAQRVSTSGAADKVAEVAGSNPNCDELLFVFSFALKPASQSFL